MVDIIHTTKTSAYKYDLYTDILTITNINNESSFVIAGTSLKALKELLKYT